MSTQKPVTRQYLRARLDLYVNKIIGDEPHLARVRDISEDGVFLYRLLEPTEDASQRVGLELKLPNSKNIIWAVGKVVRDVPGQGVGVQFTRIAETDRVAIKDFVTHHRLAGTYAA